MNVSTLLMRSGIAIAAAGLFFIAPLFSGPAVGSVVVGAVAIGGAVAALGWVIAFCGLVWGGR